MVQKTKSMEKGRFGIMASQNTKFRNAPETFEYSFPNGGKIGAKGLAQMLIGNLLEGIPYSAKNKDDVKANRKLICNLTSIISVMKEDFLTYGTPILSKARDNIDERIKSGKTPSASEAVSELISSELIEKYKQAGGDIKKLLK